MQTLPFRQRGFSLPEIMVGLTIGLVAMVVVMQVFAVSDRQKRTASSGADAQTNGSIALYLLERDARMAGWGLDTSFYADCDRLYTYCDGDASCGGTEGALDGFSLGTVRITDGGDGPDALSVQYFADPTVDAWRFGGQTTLSKTMPQPSAVLDVDSTAGCQRGSLMLVAQSGSCTLMQITQVQDAGGNAVASAPASGGASKLQHNPGNNGHYNPPASYQNENHWPAYSAGAALACMRKPSTGTTFRRSYRVDRDRHLLLRSDNAPATAVVDEEVAAEIFDLQAQYGIANAGAQSVAEWVDATGTWANPSLADWRRIKAIRIALVARSAQYERPAGGECTTTTKAMSDKWSSWASFDTTKYPADWKCYRYKVFETVAPMRNTLWGNL